MGSVAAAALYSSPGIREIVKPSQAWHMGVLQKKTALGKGLGFICSNVNLGVLFSLISQVLNRVKIFLLSRTWHVLLFGTE